MSLFRGVWGQSHRADWGWKLCMSLRRREQEKAKLFAEPAAALKAIGRCREWNRLEMTFGSCIPSSQSCSASMDHHKHNLRVSKCRTVFSAR